MKELIRTVCVAMVFATVIAGCVAYREDAISRAPVYRNGEKWEGPFPSCIAGAQFGYDGTVVYKNGKPWSGLMPDGGPKGGGGIDDWRLNTYSNGVVVSTMTLRQYYETQKE